MWNDFCLKDVGFIIWDVFVRMAIRKPVIIRRYMSESFSILAPECLSKNILPNKNGWQIEMASLP